MFGFFKNKNKDKAVTKDKNSDIAKDKKKDKLTKEEKEAKVALRKNKEEKSSKSIFRKSKSIERTKDGSADSIARKSRSFDGRDSGDWTDSEHDLVSRQNSAATESEDDVFAPSTSKENKQKQKNRVSGEYHSRPVSPVQATGAVADKPPQTVKESLFSFKSRDEKSKSDSKSNPKNMGALSAAIIPSISTFVGAVGYSQAQGNSLPDGITEAGALPTQSASTSLLAMKPPLNPRLVAPRGPLASSGNSSINSAEVLACERDESRLTPSPGIVTPPSSPGLPIAQASSPYQNSSSRPTSPDGRASMLSTPSSSTSSLSSITARPISPSGRRTPPGPRMGTGGRITSSPTAGRKAVRTNIKTNPTAATRRGGSRSPVNPSSSPSLSSSSISFIDSENLQTPPSSPVSVRHISQLCPDSPGMQVSNVPAKHSAYSSSSFSNKPDIQIIPSFQSKVSPSFAAPKTRLSSSPSPPPKVSFASDAKPDSVTMAPQRSTSPTVGKSRHSVSSMHSLESIPENESDGHTSASNTLERKSNSRGITSTNYQGPSSAPTSSVVISSQTVRTNQASRHSAPAAASERPCNPVVSHNRSYSLTPVNEEKLSSTSSQKREIKGKKESNNETPPPQKIESSLDSDIHVNKSNTPFQSSFIEATKYSVPKKREYAVKNEKEIKNENIKKNVCEGKTIIQTPSSIVSSFSTASKNTSVKPISASSTKIKESGLGVMEVKQTGCEELDPATANLKESLNNTISEKTLDSVMNPEAATHVIFRIPLCHTSVSDNLDKDRRVSLEILSGDERKVDNKERVLFKERPRSLSTSREFRREKSDIAVRRRPHSDASTRELQREKSDLAIRRRPLSDAGNEKMPDPEKPEARVRRRSSSARRQRSLRDQTPDDERGSSTKNMVMDEGEAIAPWRRKTRSRSRASETREQPIDPSETSTSDEKIARNIRSTKENKQQQIREDNGALTEEKGESMRSEITTNTDPASNVTAPPRHRSRNSDRRATRSVTLEDIQQAKMEAEQETKEPKEKRRTRSSTRASESTLTKSEDGAGNSSRPRRRRSLSTKRSGGVAVRNDDSVVQDIPQSVLCISESTIVKDGQKNIRQADSNTDLTSDIVVIATKGSVMSEAANKTNASVKSSGEIENSVILKTSQNEGSNTKEGKASVTQKLKTVSKRSIELQTESVQSVSKLCQTEEDNEAQRLLEEAEDRSRKELAAQEERYQKQVDHLTLTLAQSQEEVSKLNSTIEDLQDAKEALQRAEELEEKLSLLQQDVRDRNAQLDFARSEVQGTKNEMEITKGKLKKLEEDLDAAKQKNQALQNQITATANCDRTEELEGKIRDIQETLKHTEEARDKLTKTIEEIETERDDEVKIIQEALDEAAQEREDLINTFEKEFQNMTTMNSTREQQLMEDFEWKLREMEKEHKKKLEEHDKRAENTLHRVKRQAEEAEAEFKQKQEKMKNELNAEWEDKLRSECSRLKSELDELHAEEKHLAVESMKVQKEQEIRTLKQTWEKRQEETTKEISKLKDSLTEKDAYYHKEMENQRTTADRDVWELRRKLQRLDEKNWSQQEFLQEKHQEELERVRMDYKDRVDDLEKRLAVAVEDCNEESRAQANKLHNDEMEHLCQQHRLSMERLREELESEKFQAVEEARVIVSQHLEYINTTLKEQLAEAVTSSTQYRDELEAVRAALAVREEVIVSMEDKLNILKANSSNPNNTSSYKDSQSSLASSSEESGSSGNNSQDRLSFSESMGASIDSQDEAHKSGGSSLLGKVFGGGWFSSTKGKENSRRGSSVPNKTTSS